MTQQSSRRPTGHLVLWSHQIELCWKGDTAMTRLLRCVILLVLAIVMVSNLGLAQVDHKGCKDYPLLTRIPGFYIKGCKELPFTTHKFTTQKGKEEVEGHFISISYSLPEGAAPMSGIEMVRNYTNAIRQIGGTVLYEGRYSGSMRVSVEGREVWIEVLPYGKTEYRLDIIEKKAMEQQVVADAAALLADLEHQGHVVLSGIYFDTDKAVIKPESEAALQEIAKLLREHPAMKAFIVGHTDMSGSFEHNLDLSRRRAEAVVHDLVTRFKISGDRLTARGVGPLAPVGSNNSANGRALNRRVELVQRVGGGSTRSP